MDLNVLLNNANTNLADFSDITPPEHRAVLYEIFKRIALKGEVRIVTMLTADIPTYFEMTGVNEGLGIVGFDYEGWAIMNGKNGTINAGGRTPVFYDKTDYPQISGSTSRGGAKAHTLTEPELPALEGNFETISFVNNGGNGISVATSGSPAVITGGNSDFLHKNIRISFGNNQPHNNMQPYQVFLGLQKI